MSRLSSSKRLYASLTARDLRCVYTGHDAEGRFMTAIGAKSAMVRRYSQFSLHPTPAPARVIAEERVLYLWPHLGIRRREEGVAVKGSGAPIKRSIRCSYLRSYLSLSSTHASGICVHVCGNERIFREVRCTLDEA